VKHNNGSNFKIVNCSTTGSHSATVQAWLKLALYSIQLKTKK